MMVSSFRVLAPSVPVSVAVGSILVQAIGAAQLADRRPEVS